MEEKQKLLKLIQEADVAYYQHNNSIMSDTEYDALRAKFIENYGSEELNYVPTDVLTANKAKKFTHIEPVLSLGKVKITEKDKLDAEIRKFNDIIIQPKLDGLTVVAYPNKETGRYTFVTRGDGLTGEILPNFISKYEKKFKFLKDDVKPIRGEVLLSYKDFDDIVEQQKANGETPFTNIRNAAAGILRNKERSPYIDKLEYICYDVLDLDKSVMKKMHNFLCDTPFEVVGFITYHNGFNRYDSLTTAPQRQLQEDFEMFQKQGLPLDGIVIKANEDNSLAKYGSTNHHPNNAFAVKFAEKVYTTILRDIQWQVGKNKVTPVACFDAAEIDGSIVEKASLANIGIIKKLGLRKGSVIEVIKSNEVIPKIVKVISSDKDNEEIEVPKVCPCCGKPLTIENEQLYCNNSLCKEKIAQKMAYVCSKKILDIEGLSISTARKIVDYYEKKNILYDFLVFFNMSMNDFLNLEGFAKKSAKNLLDNILEVKRNGISISQAVACTCVQGIGLTIGKALEQRYSALWRMCYDLSNKETEQLMNIDGIGSQSIDALCSKEFIAAITTLSIRCPIRPNEKAAEKQDKAEVKKKKTFVLTGKMQYPRKHYEELIENASHIVGSSVTKNTTYLVVPSDKQSSNSTKAKKAKELGITVITDLEIEKYL
jgi:DNA ligase (NAD+)